MKSKSYGISLIEVVIVGAILAILMAIGVPQYRAHQARRALDGDFRELGATLMYAREVAVAQGGATVVFPSTNPPICEVRNGAGQTVRRLTGDRGVVVALPNGAATHTFAANGSVTPGGQFTLSHSAVGNRPQIILNRETGGVVMRP